LIVDDNRDAADSLAELLRLWGHATSVAYDGAAGLAAAVSQRPDCLLLDINMPYLDGYQVARTVRRQAGLEGVKLIAVSALIDANRAAEAGFDYRLTKPADPTELEGALAMIGRIMQLAGRTEELARQNAEAAARAEAITLQAAAVVGETRDLLREVKEDLKEVKHEVRDLKDEIREVKDRVAGTDPCAPGS